jgi:hypothetical protein
VIRGHTLAGLSRRHRPTLSRDRRMELAGSTLRLPDVFFLDSPRKKPTRPVSWIYGEETE